MHQLNLKAGERPGLAGRVVDRHRHHSDAHDSYGGNARSRQQRKLAAPENLRVISAACPYAGDTSRRARDEGAWRNLPTTPCLHKAAL
jgi:hypothetical protein